MWGCSDNFMKRVTFNPEISSGHILQLIVMLLALVVLYGDARAYKERTEMRLKRLEESDKATAEKVAVQAKEQTEATTRLSDAVIELSTVVGIQRRTSRFGSEPSQEQQQRKQP